MVWFRVDDNLSDHPKVLTAGNAAMGLWVRAGAWSMKHLTDGFVPDAVARSFGTRREIKALTFAGLWVVADGGFRLADSPRWESYRESDYRPRVPQTVRDAVILRDGGACLRCGSVSDLQMDHVYPWSRGGPTTFENLQTLCGPCNRAKGATVESEVV